MNYLGCKAHSAAAFLALISVFFTSTNALSASSLISQATEALNTHFAHMLPQADITIALNSISTQINYRYCKKFDFSLPTTLPAGGRISVKATCLSPTPWYTYITGKVTAFSTVATASRHLSKGQALSAHDIRFVKNNIATLSQGYFATPEQIIGRTAKRHLNTGAVITPQALLAEELVAKGDKVTIEAGSPPLSVRMPGTALSGGQRGEQIQIRNDKSGLIVTGYIAARGLVRTAR